MSKAVVSVQISGQEYRIRTDAEPDSLHRVAGLVDAAMNQVAARTGTVDTLDVAVLTSLNLGRELVALREKSEVAGAVQACLLYTSPSPRDKRQSRMPSSA